MKVIDPLYIQPELNQIYILFLSKDDDFDRYYGAIEPFSILINEDDIAELKSNLLNAENGELVSSSNHTVDGQTIEVSTYVEGELSDAISGESLEELIAKIEGFN